jgi:putative DNA primase/helicase
MGGDTALIAYLQRVCGYCLTGDTSEQALFFNCSGGAMALLDRAISSW